MLVVAGVRAWKADLSELREGVPVPLGTCVLWKAGLENRRMAYTLHRLDKEPVVVSCPMGRIGWDGPKEPVVFDWKGSRIHLAFSEVEPLEIEDVPLEEPDPFEGLAFRPYFP